MLPIPANQNRNPNRKDHKVLSFFEDTPAAKKAKLNKAFLPVVSMDIKGNLGSFTVNKNCSLIEDVFIDFIVQGKYPVNDSIIFERKTGKNLYGDLHILDMTDEELDDYYSNTNKFNW